MVVVVSKTYGSPSPSEPFDSMLNAAPVTRTALIEVQLTVVLDVDGPAGHVERHVELAHSRKSGRGEAPHVVKR